MKPEREYWPSEEELCSWDYHIKVISESEKFDEASKKRTLEGYKHLRRIFGEDWLGILLKKSHPLSVRMIYNTDPYFNLYAANIGIKLAELEGITNFDMLRQGLMNRDEFDSWEAVLEVAYEFKRCGYDVDVIAPDSHSKKPDLVARLGEREIYSEVTSLGDPIEREKLNKTLWQFMDLTHLLLPDVHVAGIVHKWLSPAHTNELLKEIKNKMMRVKAERCCIEVNEPNVIDCFIAPIEKLKEFQEWIRRMNGIHGWMGLPVESNEVRRIGVRLEGKIQQLPLGSPGVLVIYHKGISSPDLDHDNLIGDIEETIYEHKNLSAVVVVLKYFWEPEKKFSYVPKNVIVKDTVIRESKDGVMAERQRLILIENKYTNFPLNSNELNILENF